MRIRRLFSLLVVLVLLTATVPAQTEQQTVWVLCRPGSSVNIRSRASSRSEIVGYASCADGFVTDGRRKNGFVHVYASIETGEGWISSRYIVDTEPAYVGETRSIDSTGRVQARQYIGGKRLRWLRPGQEVMVYWISDWAITDVGYVRWEFIGEE